MDETRKAKYWSENMKGGHHLKDPFLNGKIILE
jgi:hypothetical protein